MLRYLSSRAKWSGQISRCIHYGLSGLCQWLSSALFTKLWCLVSRLKRRVIATITFWRHVQGMLKYHCVEFTRSLAVYCHTNISGKHQIPLTCRTWGDLIGYGLNLPQYFSMETSLVKAQRHQEVSCDMWSATTLDHENNIHCHISWLWRLCWLNIGALTGSRTEKSGNYSSHEILQFSGFNQGYYFTACRNNLSQFVFICYFCLSHLSFLREMHANNNASLKQSGVLITAQFEEGTFDCPLCQSLLYLIVLLTFQSNSNDITLTYSYNNMKLISIWYDPITTPCGHSYCKDCIVR